MFAGKCEAPDGCCCCFCRAIAHAHDDDVGCDGGGGVAVAAAVDDVEDDDDDIDIESSSRCGSTPPLITLNMCVSRSGTNIVELVVCVVNMTICVDVCSEQRTKKVGIYVCV